MHRLPARLIAIAAACAATPVVAATYTVGSGAGCTHATIQAAIDAADAAGSTGADEIRLSGGPYTAQALTMHIAAAHGAVSLVGGFATCTSAAPTAGARTVIGGRSSGSEPALRISDTADATLRNLEIRDAASAGGLVVETGVSGSAASLVDLIDTQVVHNTAVAGGGVLLANYNPASLPDRLRLRLLGSSVVAYNVGLVRGGGIACDNASLELRESASIHWNSAGSSGFAGSLDGGGIHARDCRVDVSSGGTPGNGVLYLNSAAFAGRGGGLYLTGTRGEAVFHPTEPEVDVFVSGNRALDGGGIAVADGANVRLFATSLIDNVADRAGAAVWLGPGGGTGVDTRLLMQSSIDGAPEGTPACASPAYCAMVTGNRAVDTSGNATPGAVLTIANDGAGSAHAAFRGVRMQQNDGYSLMAQGTGASQVVLDGSLIADNTIRGSFGAFTVAGGDGAFVLSASTVAGNTFTQAVSPVFGTPITCDVADDEVGVHLRRSIVWQPGRGLLFTLFDPPQADCFTHLVANDFGWLGAAADRVVADPAFENVAGGNYALSSTSPALDFAPAHATDTTLDGGSRVIDLPSITNLFGPQDLGAFERTYSPTVSASVIGTGGIVGPASQPVPYGQPAQLSLLPFGSEWHAITPLGGNCPAGTLAGNDYTTGPITADCTVTVDFIRDTSIVLNSTDDDSVYGQNLTFTATLAASSPTGSVTFRDGANLLGTAPISASSASFSTSALGVGTHSITATYAGDADNTAATSPVFVQTVNRNATTTTLAMPAPVRLGEAAAIVATVAPVAPPGVGTPGGSVMVQVTTTGGSGSCTITLPATGCTLTPLGAFGPLTIAASYSGDANFTASSATQTLNVTPQYVGGTIGGLSAEGLGLRLVVDGDQVQTTGASAGATTFQFSYAVPVGASYLVNVATHPPGLFCAVANGSGTMPAGDVGNIAIACSDAPHAVLAVDVDDGIEFARYGQVLTYTATVGNVGNANATGVSIIAIAGLGLDAGALAWTCTPDGVGADCGAGDSGNGLGDMATIPAGTHVTYRVTVPVLAVTDQPRVRFEIHANGGEQFDSDSDLLVLLRDGFDGE